MARVGGDVQLAGWRVSGGRAPSGRKWNGSQSGQGAHGTAQLPSSQTYYLPTRGIRQAAELLGLDGLLESRALQVLAELLQGDQRTSPAASS